MKLRVQRFVPEDIKENRIIFIIGKRGTGKTILLRDIMSKYPPVDICVGMTPTEETADVFREFLPESCIYHEFNLAKLEQMLAVQRELIRKKINRRFLLILDDCLYQKGCLKSSAMRDLVMNGRHLHIALAVCVQYLMDISPDIRANIDYTFALRENIIANRAKMWKFFFGMFSKYEDFAKAMDATTNNFCCMVMDNTNKSTAVEDTVFWYKAGLELNEFKMGRSCYWKMDKRCLMSREDREREEQANTKKDASRERITTVQTEDPELEDVDDDVRESLSNLGKLYTTLWSYRASLPISFAERLPQKILDDAVDLFKQLDRRRLRVHKETFLDANPEYAKNMAHRAAWYKVMNASDQDVDDEHLERVLNIIEIDPGTFYEAVDRESYGDVARLLGKDMLKELEWARNESSFWAPMRTIAGMCTDKKHISWVAADVVRRSILIACVRRNPPQTARLTDRTVRFADEELSDVLGDNLQPKKLFS